MSLKKRNNIAVKWARKRAFLKNAEVKKKELRQIDPI
jgi:hypothetical protein